MLGPVLTQPRPSLRVFVKALASASAVVLLLGACGGGSVAVDEDLPLADEVDAAPDTTDADLAAGDYDDRATYCPPAEAGYAALGDMLNATDRKSLETGKEGDTGNVAVMNEAGGDILAHMELVVSHWTEAQTALEVTDYEATSASVSGDAANEAYSVYFEYIDDFARPEAHIAAESNSVMEYDLAVAELMSEGGGIGALITGAEALNTVVEFNLEHCDIEWLPGLVAP